MSNGKIKVGVIDIKLSNIEDVMYEHAKSNAENVAKKAPKRTKAYADSIGVMPINSGGYKTEKDKAVSFAVGSLNSQYTLTHILELGTVKQKAQPHFRPAFEEDRKELIKKLKTQVELKNNSTTKNI
jgi:HK97 gp10 family phage protein